VRSEDHVDARVRWIVVRTVLEVLRPLAIELQLVKVGAREQAQRLASKSRGDGVPHEANWPGHVGRVASDAAALNQPAEGRRVPRKLAKPRLCGARGHRLKRESERAAAAGAGCLTGSRERLERVVTVAEVQSDLDPQSAGGDNQEAPSVPISSRSASRSDRDWDRKGRHVGDSLIRAV
jgi:hypothetical protein